MIRRHEKACMSESYSPLRVLFGSTAHLPGLVWDSFNELEAHACMMFWMTM